MFKTHLKPTNYFVFYFAWTCLVALLSLHFPWFLLIGLLGLIFFTVVDWRIKLLPCLFAFLILSSFFVHFLINHLTVKTTDFTKRKFVVTNIRATYAILQHRGIKYYLSLTNWTTEQIYLHQTLVLWGKAQPLNHQANYFEFDFQNFLHQKNVFQELFIDQSFCLKTGWLFKINLFYQRFFRSEFSQVFLLNNRDQRFALIKATNEVGITYLLNFGGLPLFFVSWTFNDLLKKNKVRKKTRNLCCLGFDLIFLFFSFILNFPFVLTRITLTLLVRNLLKARNISPNLTSVWIIVYSCLISLDNSLIQNEIFLYYLMVLLFFKLDSSKPLLIQLGLNFLISNLTFGVVNLIIDKRFFYFNEFFDLLLAPFLGLMNLFTWFTFWIPKIDLVYDFLNNLLVKELLLLAKVNFFYAGGYVPLYFYLIYFCFLKLFFLDNYFLRWKFVFFVGTLISLMLIFTYKYLFFQSGIEILNVGNGQTIVLRQLKKMVLFDAGAGPGHAKTILKSYCQYWGITQIDQVFLSHYHDDHYNQLEALLADKVKIKNVVRREQALDFYQIGQAKIHVFNINKREKNENNNSLVYLVNFQKINFMIMSDLEMSGEINLLQDQIFLCQTKNQTIDYLLLGHHGSKTSTSYQLLAYLRPKLAFISGEKRGLRQFPNQETIVTLEKLKIPYKITNNRWNFLVK